MRLPFSVDCTADTVVNWRRWQQPQVLEWLKVPSNREGAGSDATGSNRVEFGIERGRRAHRFGSLPLGSQSTNSARPERGCTSKAPSAWLQSVAFRFALPTLAASLFALQSCCRLARCHHAEN